MTIAIDAREATGTLAGKGRYVLELIKALAEIDQANQYILYSKEPLNAIPSANFKNILIGGYPGLRQLWLALDAKKRGCTILFAPTGYLPIVFSLIPSVVTVHDLALFVTRDAKPAIKTLIAEKLLLGLAVRKAKHVIAVSASTKNDLVKYFSLPSSKITVTPLGYDTACYQPATQKEDRKILDGYHLSTAGYLLFLGTLEPRKNIVGLIKAYALLPKEQRAQFRLVIGGKKGWYYDEIFTTVKELKLERDVQFLGRVPDEHLPALYRGAKIFLFPSFYEGFGLPPLEALACGTPVITSNNSSLPEVVGKAGLLVNPYSVENMRKAIDTLLTDKKKYELLKKLTIGQANKFSWQKTAIETLHVIRKAV